MIKWLDATNIFTANYILAQLIKLLFTTEVRGPAQPNKTYTYMVVMTGHRTTRKGEDAMPCRRYDMSDYLVVEKLTKYIKHI